jgi:hypothetical protein
VFCPRCKDEFRPGFTRCGVCGVELVPSLSVTPPASPAEAAGPVRASIAVLPMIDYCGFLSLEDARASRDRLRAESMRSDIVIREAPDSDLTGPAREEYWLRVERDRYREAAALLGYEEVESDAEDDSFTCGDCGHQVSASENFCPGCGARFEDG